MYFPIHHLDPTHERNWQSHALSHVGVNTLSSQTPAVNFKAMAAAQQDLKIQQFSSSLALKPMPVATYFWSYHPVHVSTGTPHASIYVLSEFWHLIFDSLRSLSHPNSTLCHSMLYVWPNINSNVRRWACTLLLTVSMLYNSQTYC